MPVKYQKDPVRLQPGSQANPVMIPSHDLEQSRSAVSLNRSGRYIPGELYDCGRLLAEVCNTVQIHEGLQKEAKKRGLDHTTWDVSDVRREFPCDLGNGSDFDAAGLVEHLETRKIQEGLHYFATVDRTSHLNKIFVEMSGARSEWAMCLSSEKMASLHLTFFSSIQHTVQTGTV